MTTLERDRSELVGTGRVTDAELEALALEDGADQPLAPDAVPLSVYLGESPGLLPAWYMPPVALRRSRGWRTPVVLLIVGILLALEILGLCSVFGQVVIG